MAIARHQRGKTTIPAQAYGRTRPERRYQAQLVGDESHDGGQRYQDQAVGKVGEGEDGGPLSGGHATVQVVGDNRPPHDGRQVHYRERDLRVDGVPGRQKGIAAHHGQRQEDERPPFPKSGDDAVSDESAHHTHDARGRLPEAHLAQADVVAHRGRAERRRQGAMPPMVRMPKKRMA